MSEDDFVPSYRLFSRPSFLEGMARLIDFGGNFNLYNRSASAAEADVRAVAADWRAVGQDMRKAMSR